MVVLWQHQCKYGWVCTIVLCLLCVSERSIVDVPTESYVFGNEFVCHLADFSILAFGFHEPVLLPARLLSLKMLRLHDLAPLNAFCLRILLLWTDTI